MMLWYPQRQEKVKGRTASLTAWKQIVPPVPRDRRQQDERLSKRR